MERRPLMSENHTKQCTKCKEIKGLNQFYKDNRKYGSIRPQCIKCMGDANRANKQKNREYIKIKTKEYKKKNKERIKEYTKRNENKIKARMKHYYELNKKNIMYKQNLYRQKDRKINPAKYNAESAKRRAQKLNATPKWLSENQKMEIFLIYKECSRISKETGVEHHVDHIIPLNGKNVSGLHVPWNLQILEALGPQGNCAKGNKIIEIKKPL